MRWCGSLQKYKYYVLIFLRCKCSIWVYIYYYFIFTGNRYTQTQALICRFCVHSRFDTVEEWKTHQLTVHRNDVTAICDECRRTFKTKKGLLCHKKIYHSPADEKYQCLECGKFFISEYKLGIHKRMHSLDRPFKCSKCSSSYKHKHVLQKHEQTKHNVN